MAAGEGKAAEEKGKIGATGVEKEAATANKEKGAMAEEKEEKGAAAEEKEATLAEVERAETEEKEAMFSSFSRTTFLEKGAAADKEKGATAEKEEKGAKGEDKGEKGLTAEEKEAASAERGKKRAEAEEKEAIFQGAAAKGERREQRRFRRTDGRQRPEKKGSAAEDVAGEKATFFFTSGKIITLMSSDGVLFKMSEEAARLSVLLSDMIDEGCAGSTIPLPNVDARSLDMVIEYCEEHAAAAAKHAAEHGTDEGSSSGNSEASREALKGWDRDFINGLRMDALYDIMKAANFLHVKELLGLACQKVADMIKAKTPEQVRELFGIANDFTEEEEEEIRKENPWAYEE